jgi:CheY-like chemotaxis protein
MMRPVVLIVEDDLMIRMDAIEMIETPGFGTLEAANADEAIAIQDDVDFGPRPREALAST